MATTHRTQRQAVANANSLGIARRHRRPPTDTGFQFRPSGSTRIQSRSSGGRDGGGTGDIGGIGEVRGVCEVEGEVVGREAAVGSTSKGLPARIELILLALHTFCPDAGLK